VKISFAELELRSAVLI